jgi:cytochrome c-type biogenesis protein CcmH/NrfG
MQFYFLNRCKLEQKESPPCEFCGFVFEAHRDSTPAAKVVRPNRIVWMVIILVVAGALVAAYLLISYQDKPGEKSASAERSSDLAQKINENELRATAKE